MKISSQLKTINNTAVSQKHKDLDGYKYQEDLTKKLKTPPAAFTQKTINEIALWKVNRYFELPAETLEMLNQVSDNEAALNIVKTKEILAKLLAVKGIQLPMASTILRFKNPNVYQIIDQRAYRFLGKGKLKTTFPTVEKKIECYMTYLQDLRKACEDHGIPFNKADQVLYLADKELNKSIPLTAKIDLPESTVY